MPEPSANPVERYHRLRYLFERDRGNARLRRDCLDAAAAAGEFEFVRSEADAALAASPDDPMALFDAATARIGLRDYPGARDILLQLEAMDPVPAAVHTNLALCHYCLAEHDAARQAAERGYSEGARDAGTLRLLISSCHHLGMIDEARAIADANPEVAKSDGALAGAYALLYLDADDAKSAARWARAALASHPDSIDGLVVDATVATAQMDLERAARQYQRVVELAPRTGRAWLGLGMLSMLTRDLTAAKVSIARGLEYLPEHVGSWHALAWAHLLSGETAEAEKAFNRALELDRNFAETHGGLASLAALRGERAAAQRFIEVARRLDPRCLSAILPRAC